MIPAQERRSLVLGALALALLAAFVVRRFELTNDITHFLPGGQTHTRLELARELAAGELSRTLVLVVGAPDQARALAASRDLQAALQADPTVRDALLSLTAGPPSGLEEALWTLYAPRRLGFRDTPPGVAVQRLTAPALAAAVRHLKRQLASPLSSLVSRVAGVDPLLILPGLFESMAASQADSLAVVEGRFLTLDGRHAVLFLTSRAPAFDSGAQAPLAAGIQAAFEHIDAAADGGLDLRLSGASRFALRAEAAIRRDIQRVTVGSLLGLLLLLGVLFRSLRLVLLMLPVISAGFLVGTSACLLLHGRIHGLTLAFGAALIGVSIDYTVHTHCRHILAPDPRGPRHTLARIWPGLTLCAATTIVGFLILLVSNFPGMRELALFAATGIAAALLATRVFLPGLMPRQAPVTRTTRAASRALELLAEGLLRRRLASGTALVLLIGSAAFGLLRLEWNDDFADLQQLDPELLAEDESVRAQVVRYEQRRIVVAVGADEQAALEVNDRVYAVLAEARDAGELGNFRSLGPLLPSARLQSRRDAALRDDPDLWPRMQTALAAEGFVTAAFEPFRDTLAAPAPEPLTWDDLAVTPLGSLVSPFRATLPDGVAILSFLHELHDEAALARRLAALDGALLIDIGAEFGQAYAGYRERLTRLLLLGLVAVVGLVALRYRALRPTLVACLPAILSAAITVGLLSLAGVALNMLSLVALLMVVSMGVDYGVFLAEAGDDRAALGATRLSVLVSGCSTALGFGLLALSDHPSLSSIGSTACLGIVLCLLGAPLLQHLTRPRLPP